MGSSNRIIRSKVISQGVSWDGVPSCKILVEIAKTPGQTYIGEISQFSYWTPLNSYETPILAYCCCPNPPFLETHLAITAWPAQHSRISAKSMGLNLWTPSLRNDETNRKNLIQMVVSRCFIRTGFTWIYSNYPLVILQMLVFQFAFCM